MKVLAVKFIYEKSKTLSSFSILGLHVTSETFPYLGICHVGVPSRTFLKCLHMSSLEECNGVC